MRGTFERPLPLDELNIEWCERRILQRIHKLTIGARRRAGRARFTGAVSCDWLLGWQHLAPQTQLAGEEGCLKLSTSWRDLKRRPWNGKGRFCPARVADYDPRWLDRLCLSGAVGWGRVSPHPAFQLQATTVAHGALFRAKRHPLRFYLRDSAMWLNLALKEQARGTCEADTSAYTECAEDLGIPGPERGLLCRGSSAASWA